MSPDIRLTTRLGRNNCPVIVTEHGPRRLRSQLTPLARRRVALLTDRNVADLHLERYRTILPECVEIVVPPGERSKSLPSARRIYQTLLENHFGRDDLLVALGGGVVTDLGAYVASTYKRGMECCLVSTTLLGCVDAAIGGKSGVNLGRAKNAVGCFCVPRAVILDIVALDSLPRRRLSEGLVEAYKTGLVFAPRLAGLIQREASSLLAGHRPRGRQLDRPLLTEVVAMAARAKSAVVARDFRESGLRRILNLGHTYGHALEGCHGYRLSHGRAVAQGLQVALQLSRARGLLPERDADRLEATLRQISPYKSVWPPLDQIWEVMLNDKKIKGGKLVFVLLTGVGKAVCVEDVTRRELARILAKIKR